MPVGSRTIRPPRLPAMVRELDHSLTTPEQPVARGVLTQDLLGRHVARRTPRWRGLAAAFVLGAPPALAFPEADLWWLGLIGLTPLMLYLVAAPSHKDAGLRAWFGGAGYGMVGLHWLVPKIGPAIVPVSFLLGATWILWGLVAFALLSPRRGRRSLLALPLVPAAFVAGEFFRSWEHIGGPWGLLGASQWSNLPVLSVAALGGVWAVSFLLVAVNVALTRAVLPGTTPVQRLVSVLFAGALLAGALVYGYFRASPETTGTIKVAGVQPGPGLDGEERFRAELNDTRSLVSVRPDVVLWGESSIGGDPDVLRSYRRETRELARTVGSLILVNVDTRRGAGGIFKSSVLIGPEGTLGRYDKMRLVPFGEYVPLRSALGWLTRVSDAADEDRRRGERLQLLRANNLTIGPLVCFESLFPDLARRLSADGADLIVVQSATSTFQESWAPEQHASLAAVRAVESGRPVVHATLTGVSAGFDARGRRLTWFGTDQRGAYTADVPLASGSTLYVRLGDWVPVASLVLLATALLTSAARARTPRR